MVPQERVRVMLVRLVDRLPLPPSAPSPTRPRGRPRVYVDRLFLKVLVIMLVRRLTTAYELLSVLAEPTAELQTLRLLLVEQDRVPCRRTFERRLAALPATLPAPIGGLGRYLVAVWWPCGSRGWPPPAPPRSTARCCGRAAASGPRRSARRGSGRLPRLIPRPGPIDPAARWTTSGWHGWVYGWKRHRVCAVRAIWIPLAAGLTPAAAANHTPAPALIRERPLELHFLLGDQHYRDAEGEDLCALRGGVLVTPMGGPYHKLVQPYDHDGMIPCGIRRAIHRLIQLLAAPSRR